MVVWIQIAVISLPMLLSYGMIAYDCEDKSAELTTISLRDISQCPEPEQAYASELKPVNVIQRTQFKSQRVWTCLIEVTRLITYCGMHSHSSVVDGGLMNYIYKVGAEECREMHRYRTLKLYHQTIGGLTANSTTFASLTIVGDLDNSGKCTGAVYHEDGRTWRDVVITATAKIHLRDYYGTVKLEDNEMVLDNRVVCPFLPGYCFDATLGEVVWSPSTPESCENHLSLIYDGLGEIVSNRGTNERFLVVERENKVFALTLTKRVAICNVEVWQTEHPKVLVAEGKQLIPTAGLLPQDTDLMTYVNSKFLYVEQSYQRGLDRLYVDTIHRRCLLQREVLRNRLLMAPIMPSVISQVIEQKEGYIGRVLGEVLYVMKCVPKPVAIRRIDRCYQELPVEVNNQSRFMAPLTRILQKVAEEIECNGLTPALYYIDGEWIGMSPHPTLKHPPLELSVDTGPKLNFTSILPIGSQGLYTQEEMSQVQRLMTFGNERAAVQNIIARRVVGLDTHDQGLTPVNMFSPEELSHMAQHTARQIWGWFSDIGTVFSGLLGVYFVFRLIKYALGCIINGLHLYKTVGSSVKLLACLWNTLTMWVLHQHTQRQNRTSNLEEDATLAEIPMLSTAKSAPAAVRLFPTPSSGPHWTELELVQNKDLSCDGNKD